MQEAQLHPSKGGLGYPVSQRAESIQNFDHGLPISASKASISRWKKRLHPKKRQKGQKNHLNGEYLEILKYYRLTYPKAYLTEVSNALLQLSSEPRIFHPSMISKAESALHLTWKRGSTAPRQQLSPEVVQRRENFFSQPPPLGIKGIPIGQLIDIDESGFNLQSTNRSYGKAFRGVRVIDRGNYSRTAQWNLILAICGDGDFKFGKISTNTTDTIVFYEYIQGVLSNLPPNRQFYFLWDNLSVHNSPNISNLIHSYGHSVIPRPPYSPEYAPIELVFNCIDNKLMEDHFFVDSNNEFVQNLQTIVGGLHNFEAYFHHCHYI